MMAADGGVAKFARKRLESMIASLSVYGIEISESETPEAMELLRAVIERENYVNSNLSITDKKSYKKLSSPVRNDASRIMRRFALEEDEEYRRLRDKWYDFLRLHQKGGTKNE
jgi:23S rRNA U2552 (ribose-2'-O)-methylase RlmE/FtsJ